MFSFSAVIFKEGMNYLVEVPRGVSEKLNQSGYIPVTGFVEEVPFKGTCVPRRENRYVLFLDSAIRNKTHKTEHDNVTLRIEFDPESRELSVPEDMEMILSEENGLFEKFMKLTPAHRRELIKYVLTAKRPETRLKYIERVADHTRNHKSRSK